MWLKSGDTNSKFFHKVASFNRNRKHIWAITKENRHILTGQEAIKEEAIFHFEQFFKEKDRPNPNEVIKHH
jgi:uncharacterized membrane protein YvbJ